MPEIEVEVEKRMFNSPSTPTSSNAPPEPATVDEPQIDSSAASPTEPASDEPARCEGFSWIGQSFAHCDECGKPYWEHAHRREHKPGARLFTADSEVLVPITPDDAARVRAKWDAPGPAASGTPGGGL